MGRFKKISLICLNLFFIVGCSNNLDKIIDFLNKKQVNVFTYRNEYSDLKRIKNYKVFNNPNELKISGDYDYICVGLSMNDFDETFYTKDFFESIWTSLKNHHSHFLLYGFESLDFLKETPFDYKPKLDDYSNDKENTVIFYYDTTYESFSHMEYQVHDYGGISSFEDTIITYIYQRVYDYEATL